MPRPLDPLRTLMIALTVLALGGCMIGPVTKKSTAEVVFEQKNLQITASFNVLLMHNLILRINKEVVIDQPIGNPVFPPHTDRKALLRFSLIRGRWAGHEVVAACNQGTLARSRLYPSCQVLLDDEPVATLSF
jgi:hypothetical protein